MFRFFRDKAKVKEIEIHWTPLEIAEAAARGEVRLNDLHIGPVLEKEAPQRFVRHRLSANAILFSSRPDVAGLVVIFTGKSGRTMVPLSVQLQFIDEACFDVLVLADPGRLHYTAGVEPFGNDIAALALGLRRFAAERGYHRIFTYGESMGGLPSLAAGRMAGATRAISVGGRFAWHIRRLLEGRDMPAFEALCPCTKSETELLLVYSAWMVEDRDHANLVQSRLPGARLIAIDHFRHNPIMHLFKHGELKPFLAAMLARGETPAAVDGEG